MANVGWTISLSGSSAEKKRALDEMESRKDKRHYCREIVISSCAKVRGKPRDQTTVDTCLPTNLPPQITDEVRVSSDWVYKLRKNIEAF
jgi:hypothetical protein